MQFTYVLNFRKKKPTNTVILCQAPSVSFLDGIPYQKNELGAELHLFG